LFLPGGKHLPEDFHLNPAVDTALSNQQGMLVAGTKSNFKAL
jgi:hypothetical protein